MHSVTTTFSFRWPFYPTLIPLVSKPTITNPRQPVCDCNQYSFTDFFDIPAIINNLDYVVLPSFDFQTPARNHKEADYSAPLYELNERIKESNINSQVLYWLAQHAPASKLIVGIPAFGRSWKLEQDSTQTGVPPILGVCVHHRWPFDVNLTENFCRHFIDHWSRPRRHPNQNGWTLELSGNLC